MTTSEEHEACDDGEFEFYESFNSSASSSYTPDGRGYRINYAGASGKGFLGVDTLTLGDDNSTYKLLVPNVTFGQATDLFQFFDSGFAFEGVIGLGFQPIAMHNVTPPIIAAIQQGLLAEPLFTAFLDESSNNEYDGVFTFGAVDTNNCQPVQGWVNLSDAGYWQFQMDGVKVPGKYRSTRNVTAISSTGSGLIIGPPLSVARIAYSVGAEYLEGADAYLISCKSTYTVTLTIGGQDYSLTEKALSLGSDADSNSNSNYEKEEGNNEVMNCVFGIAPGDDSLELKGIDWVLGDPFMRQFCTVYDVGQERIGFAPSKNMS